MAERFLVVDDDHASREALRRLLQMWDHEVATAESAEEALDALDRWRPSAVFTDLVMPGMDGIAFARRVKSEYGIPVVVFSGQGSIKKAVEAISEGALDFLEKPVQADRVEMLLKKLANARESLAREQRLQTELVERGKLEEIETRSEKMKAVLRQIKQVAPSTLSVLIVGESGTGKELVAQTLHRLSPRRRHEFVPVNCAAIPATLLESEIFGHERGAFTGAIQRKIGCFEAADRGTLFLDEIAEMDEILQAKLLRVLQEQSFRRLGGRDTIKADVRVVAATNREPMKAIADGKLREDLYYRLNVFLIVLPPLRDRPEDIPLLAHHFAEQFAHRNAAAPCPISAAALQQLVAHPWPGNVRELKNAIERAALLAAGTVIRPDHLPPEVAAARPGAPQAAAAFEVPAASDAEVVRLRIGETMEHAERELIRSTLSHTSGNKTRAAKILGISLKTMHNKVKKFGL